MSAFVNAVAVGIDNVLDSKRPVDTDGARPRTQVVQKTVSKVNGLIASPPLKPSDLPALVDALRHSDSLDDRQLLLERILTAMSRLQKFDISKTMQNKVIKLLYDDLPHPPSGYIAEFRPQVQSNVSLPRQGYVKYAYRAADASNYNPLQPGIGKAGSPYARSVPSTKAAPRSALPDAGLVFDTLLKRDKFVEHPGGISAMFFAFADLVIHSIFNTNHTDWTVNDASSYLDLSVLYGSNDRQVQSVRRNDGSGKLLDDVFADGRLLLMPPASCALLILLNRNHNFIAQKILDINENGNLMKPYPEDAAPKQAQDEEIFQRARMVNCGFFMQIILGDYVGAILGLVRDGSDWRLDPLMPIRDSDHQLVPTGQGNVVSVEFNLLYRWHATLSQPDTTYTTNTFNKLFDGADPKDITVQTFKQAAHKYLIPPANVQEWTFGGLKRGKDNRFEDADLANVLHNATEARAGAFKARGIPEALRIIEVMGIEQSRSWGTCSLNEFRKFLGLKPYSTFEEWNPDPEIHRAAASLYRDIDNLELHVGLQAEETKLPGEGAGLCPGYTISRAILADAVSLTRGDRFMTVDFTPFNLTSWGYQDCQYDHEDGSYGGLLTKLLFRTLPDYYPRGSAYAHFPFLVPSFMKENLEKTNPTLAPKYNWTRPRAPAPLLVIDTFDGVKQVLEDSGSFMAAYDSRLFKVAEPLLAPNLAPKHTLEEEEKAQIALDAAKKTFDAGVLTVSRNVFSKPDPNFAEYFASHTSALIHEKFWSNGRSTAYVDIVRDVINLLPVHWICEEIAGLPLKSGLNPRGIWYEQETCERFEHIARYVYFNFDPVNDWKLREESQKDFQRIVAVVEAHVDRMHYLVSLKDEENSFGIKNYKSHVFLRKLKDSVSPKTLPRELATQIVGGIVPSASIYSQTVAQVVDFYLEDSQKDAREEIVRLMDSSEEGAQDKVMQYIFDALRARPPVAGAYRTVTKDTTIGPIDLKAGDHVFASIMSAERNVSAAPSDSSMHNGSSSNFQYDILSFGVNGFMTPEFFKATAPHVLSSIFRLQGLQRGPGQSGSFVRYVEEWHDTQKTEYISQLGTVTPFPDSLVVQFTR
ncbi:Linoleate 10R-lipoxygenase [Psilocybe cubensis]|uniref:Linoleate 10R-lipoxygenase n=2 Tax=Psilocybe cubensis TaxID=181762 RepID=A0ACB8GJX5_PSICU|nr:Linoleate 10R-lipoxygenase [Psilocybe cubensis]KAH9475928.1 Linoleate 10R-lipoxygenase [Psilocybe cubensis]